MRDDFSKWTPPTYATLIAKLFGTNLQGASDKSQGVDNLKVASAAVHEPEACATLLAGLGPLDAVARRWKQK